MEAHNFAPASEYAAGGIHVRSLLRVRLLSGGLDFGFRFARGPIL
jgi:hypothetical protein